MMGQEPAALLNRVVAGYQLVEVIGEGASSWVYRARRVAGAPVSAEVTAMAPVIFPEEAAVKLFQVTGGSTEERTDIRARFQAEARALRALSHPHILPIIDSGEDATTDSTYMLLPYMPGGNLAKALAQSGPLGLERVADILTALGSALDYAHTAVPGARPAIIHRDVKPANILLSADGAPFLADFGIARILTSTGSLHTRTNQIMGTPAYMSPEQFTTPNAVGPETDIYSLGMVVFELLTGHIAFQTSDINALMYQQVNMPPPSPRDGRPDLPEPAADAVLKALAKLPAARCQTGVEFAAAFSAGLRGVRMAPLTRPVPIVSAPWPGAPSAATGGPALNADAARPDAGAPVAPTPLPSYMVAPIAGQAPGYPGAQQPTIPPTTTPGAPPQSSRAALIASLISAAALIAIVVAALVGQANGSLKGMMGMLFPAGAATATVTDAGPLAATDPTAANVQFTATPVPTATMTSTPVATSTMTPTPTDTPVPHTVFTSFNVPSGGRPDGIAAGPDGALWFTDVGGNSIGRITTSGNANEFAIPTSGSNPYQIVAGADGNLWFTEGHNNNIGRCTTGGSITEYAAPTSTATLGGVALGPDGNIWFTEDNVAKVASITPSGAITEYSLSFSAFGITAGSDGNLWAGGGNQIARVTTSGTVTTYTTPSSNAGVLGMTLGPDGNVWFAEYYAGKIGRITPSGAITEFSVPTSSSYPARITSGPDGALWFTESTQGKIGRITTYGAFSEYPTSSWSEPASIALGADGNLWFTDALNKVWRYIP